ncbi:hypothetical protein ATZ36_03205 [Candidatus Endomicrobiellum trichonymphae]|uniref:Uncharacterized protein n=1 Tax=Endomicrobium trichonymphae TaxID=1408204 RepID=A0A1E5IKJ4_ENDTX|nr:hypothetical protein ATZ36_03205 [Candidatus Endomicrobium trichonymphae]
MYTNKIFINIIENVPVCANILKNSPTTGEWLIEIIDSLWKQRQQLLYKLIFKIIEICLLFPLYFCNK